MADFQLVNKQTVEKWSNTYSQEYIRENAFFPYMGTGETSIIRVRNELLGSGAIVHFPLVARLRGTGVTGGTALYGSEDTLPTYSDSVRTSVKRNAVMVTEDQSYKTDLDIFNAGRSSLKNWSAEQLRDDIIVQLYAPVVKGATETDGTPGEDSTVAYASATETNKDLWLDNNYDRILFGAAKSNISTSAPAGGATRDHSASLLNVDNTADKLSAGVIRTAKTMAKKAGSISGRNHIAPFKSDMTAGREWFVLFCGSEAFRDISQDADIKAANTYARGREGDSMDSNPLFQDGDLLYQGVIIREVPEITTLTGAGAGGIDVQACFLCGQNAVSVAYSKKPTPRLQQFDYGHRNGVGITEIRGQKKTSFNGVQYGVVTIYVAAVADA